MKSIIRSNRAFLALATICLVTVGLSAFAQSRVWVGTTDANWGTVGNWNAAAVPISTTSAQFDGAGNGNTTISLGGAARAANRVVFLTAPAAYTFNSGGSSGALTITVPSASGESIVIRSGVTTSQDLSGIANLRPSTASATFYITNSGSGTMTLPTWIGQATYTQPLVFGGSGLIEVKGAGIQVRQSNNSVSVTKYDGGTLVIYGGGTADPGTSTQGRYNGTTTINGGVLRVRNNFALGTTASGTTVATGAALELLETTVPVDLSVGEPITLNGSGISSGGALRNVAGNNTLTGLITLASDSRINSDAGTLTLDVASGNTISGAFNLTLGGAGKIALKDPISVHSVQVDDGTTFSVGTTLNLPSLTLGSSTGATLEVTGWSGNSAAITATSLTNNGTVTINIPSASLTLGQHPLLAYTGVIGGTGFGAFSLGTLPGGVGGYLTNGPSSVDLYITNVTYVAWTGTVDGDWDVMNKLNWALLGSPTNYHQLDPVLFPASAAVTNVNLTTTLTPSSVTVTNPTAHYIFAGAGKISGGTGLVKSGAGTLTILSSNDYTGGTIISAGTLQIGDGTTVGVIAGNVIADGVIVFNRSDAVTFAGAISGNGSLTKDSANTLTLTGNNTYSGGTLINGGTLQIGNSGTVGNLTGNVTNNGVVIFNRSDSLTYNGSISGSGTVTVTGNATTTFGGSNAYSGLTTITGTLKLANTNGPCLAGPALINGGSSGTKRIQLGAAEQIADSALLTMTGTGGATRLQMQGFNETMVGLESTASAGNMIVEAAGDNTANKPATITLNVPTGQSYSYAPSGSSSSYLRDAAGVTTSPLTVIKTGLGTQMFGGPNISYSGDTTISAGTLALTGSGPLANSANIVVAGGATFDVSGASPWTLGMAQTLKGGGSVFGSVTVDGTLAPGTSIGTLTFSNDLMLNGNVLIEVNTSSVPTHDTVNVLGTLIYGGTLTATNSGPPLTSGTQFQIFPAGGTGTLTLAGSPGPGLNWSFDSASGVLSVAGAPKLTYTPVDGGTALQFNWTGAYKLVAQTNALNVGLTAAWSDYPDGTNGVTVPIDPANPTVFFGLQAQ
jgi:autotransporter-associated beta strand protein